MVECLDVDLRTDTQNACVEKRLMYVHNSLTILDAHNQYSKQKWEGGGGTYKTKVINWRFSTLTMNMISNQAPKVATGMI